MPTKTTTNEVSDVRQIELLVRKYADICDEGYDPDRLAELFTADAVWAATSASGTSDFGVHEGREAIRTFFAGASGLIPFAHHIVMSPEIEVTQPGKEAVGRWNTIVLMRMADDDYKEREDEAKVLSGVYNHRYRFEDGTWRIARLDIHVRFDMRVRLVG
jgi:hypothetical protein